MIAFPPCKINLGLHILARRADGYHDLETCFYSVAWSDILEIIPAAQFSFTSSGIFISGDVNDNLCVRAYRLLAKDFDLPPVAIHLHKIIPTGAGLGGGSSDAAHTLRLLNDLFILGLSREKMVLYAAQLGSDCAFFIYDTPMLGTGRGELLEPVHVSLSGKFLVVVMPPIHISTAVAFAGVVPAKPEMSLVEILTHQSPEMWRNTMKNDFEETVFTKFSAIAQLKESLYNHGAIYASMSGSGASVFGIFDHETDLKRVFEGNDFWSGTL